MMIYSAFADTFTHTLQPITIPFESYLLSYKRTHGPVVHNPFTPKHVNEAPSLYKPSQKTIQLAIENSTVGFSPRPVTNTELTSSHKHNE